MMTVREDATYPAVYRSINGSTQEVLHGFPIFGAGDFVEERNFAEIFHLVPGRRNTLSTAARCLTFRNHVVAFLIGVKLNGNTTHNGTNDAHLFCQALIQDEIQCGSAHCPTRPIEVLGVVLH